MLYNPSFLQILLFPEGTDLTKNTKFRSDQFAEKNNLEKYQYVLHPRTTGFTHFVQEMKKGLAVTIYNLILTFISLFASLVLVL